MALTDITRQAVLRAVGEYDELGREAFLRQYHFGPAQSYFLDLNGKRYDSKAIVGAAHGFLPGQRALAPAEFSGGRTHAVKVLTDLGFQIVSPPAAAETVSDADELVRYIRKLKVAHAEGGPRLYQPITLLWAAGRALRQEPRMATWQETSHALAGLLELHGLRGERPRPDFPVLALFHSGLWTLQGHTGAVPPAHGDARLRHWFAEQQPVGGLTEAVYELLRTSGQSRVAFIGAIVDRFFAGLDEIPLLTEVGLFEPTVADDANGTAPGPRSGPDRAAVGREVVRAAQYERLCTLVERREQSIRGKRRTTFSLDPIRSATARKAVMLRSGGDCENPGCCGRPTDLTDNGDPILEVDHVTEITRDGRDHPSQMIALCPNCHAVKTRGSTRHTLTATLREVAADRHRNAMS
ncbi:HNH endonuclease signature motif containing protein [Streptomyces scopuliridis]|uniref:HNH endonuclease signature motif containing protein n=1 Tax=Streptomyces scopuliridis TaxID=452529 RepID=UPI003420FCE7